MMKDVLRDSFGSSTEGSVGREGEAAGRSTSSQEAAAVIWL